MDKISKWQWQTGSTKGNQVLEAQPWMTNWHQEKGAFVRFFLFFNLNWKLPNKKNRKAQSEQLSENWNGTKNISEATLKETLSQLQKDLKSKAIVNEST